MKTQARLHTLKQEAEAKAKPEGDVAAGHDGSAELSRC